MENASNALLMAGGVLIALIIIGVLVYSFGNISGYFESQQMKEEAEQLSIFNKQYESYNRKLLWGTDIITVVNKALDNNDKYGINGYDEPEYLITVEFELKNTVDNFQEGKVYSTSSDNIRNMLSILEKNDKANGTNNFSVFKQTIFDCKEIRYNKTTGRVNFISFVARKQNTRSRLIKRGSVKVEKKTGKSP